MRARIVYFTGAVVIAMLLLAPPWAADLGAERPIPAYLGHAWRHDPYVVDVEVHGTAVTQRIAHIDVPLLAIEILGVAFIAAFLARSLK